jgi:integrase
LATSAASPKQATEDDPLLSVAVAKWVAAHSGEHGWSLENATRCRVVMADFIQIASDRPISTYTKRDGREFREVYEGLPAGVENLKARLDVPTRDLRAMLAAAKRLGIAPQHPNTCNHKLSTVGQAFRWIANQYDACAPNPLDGVKVTAGRKLSANEEVDPFTTDQLAKILNAPVFTGCVSEREWSKPGTCIPRDSERFWLPLLALFTGARSNELCQLDQSNIQEHKGLHFILLHKDMRLKNASSERAIPIHSALVRLGFLDFVGRRTGPLFPDLKVSKSTNRQSDAFSKHFNRFLKSLGLKTKRLNFHSFRHNFTATARACGMDSECRERIIGHVYAGEGSRYGKNFTSESLDRQLLRVRAAEIEKLRHDGLDLSHLEPGRSLGG